MILKQDFKNEKRLLIIILLILLFFKFGYFINLRIILFLLNYYIQKTLKTYQ